MFIGSQPNSTNNQFGVSFQLSNEWQRFGDTYFTFTEATVQGSLFRGFNYGLSDKPLLAIADLNNSRIRVKSPFWDQTPSVASGLLYLEKNLRPFTMGTNGLNEFGFEDPRVTYDANVPRSQDNRYGIWLNYRWRLSDFGLEEDLYLQMRVERVAPFNNINIEGTNIGFRRFGIYYQNARAPLPGMTRLEFEGGTVEQETLTEEQRQNWKMIFRTSQGFTFMFDMPTTSEDPADPYIWDDGLKGQQFRFFLESLHQHNLTVDAAIIDITKIQPTDWNVLARF